MTTPGPARPAGRYDDGGRRSRRGPVALAVVLAGAFGAWVLWAALGASTPDVRSDLLGFTVPDAGSARARIEVTADARSAVICTLQAQDRDHAPVGVTRATLPAGSDATRRATVVVRTRGRAVTVVIVGCRLERPSG